MRTVTHREMRNDSGAILRAVADGESFQVTNRGRVAAVISPPTQDSLGELAAQGSVRLARRPLADLSMIKRRASKLSAAELVADARGRW
jgi:prevent-host-death family protein